MKWLGYKTFTSSAIHNKLNSVVAGRLVILTLQLRILPSHNWEQLLTIIFYPCIRLYRGSLKCICTLGIKLRTLLISKKLSVQKIMSYFRLHKESHFNKNHYMSGCRRPQTIFQDSNSFTSGIFFTFVSTSISNRSELVVGCPLMMKFTQKDPGNERIRNR